MQLFVSNKEKISHRSFLGSHQRQKTKQRPCFTCNMSTYKLFRNALSDPKDVSCVLVVFPHERLAAELSIVGRIIEAFCDLFLQINVKYIGRASRRVMQRGPQTQEKIISFLYPALIAFTQPVFAHKLVC